MMNVATGVIFLIKLVGEEKFDLAAEKNYYQSVLFSPSLINEMRKREVLWLNVNRKVSNNEPIVFFISSKLCNFDFAFEKATLINDNKKTTPRRVCNSLHKLYAPDRM